jgi:signal transduction histidine kinase
MGEETRHSGDRAIPGALSAKGSYSQYYQSLYPTSRRWFPAAVFFTGIVLTLLAAYYASRTIQLRMRAQFETAALRARATLRARFDVYDAMLHGAAGFIAVEKDITRDRFQRYIERLRLVGNYPGVQGIAYAPRVAASEKDSLVASVRQQGEPNFRIWPETGRADFFPVTYIEPENSRNDAALGYDMSSDTTRREAMLRARDTAETAASGKVTLVQEIGPAKQSGFLIYLPVYQGGIVPETVADRGTKLQGFVFCAFRAGDLFASVFADETMGTELEIFDGTNTDEANLLFRSAKRPVSVMPFRRTFEEITALDVSGRTWTAKFFAQPETERAWLVLLLLLGGIFLSCAMFYLTYAEGKARRAAERAAGQLKESEYALRESEERLRRYATELEHRVAERTANLAQSIQSLEGVLYHVAHDLRAPLRGMASFTNILLEEYGPRFDDRGRDYAHRIANAAQRMDRLVQDLLAFGRLGHTAVPVSNINLEAEVNAALRHFSDEIEGRDATVEVCTPLPPVKANAAVLNQVLSNLISNALKFVRPETTPHLRICAEETTSRVGSTGPQSGKVPLLDAQLSALDGKFVRLWIEDNGIGIAPEYHERIFRMFERLHAAGLYPGTGIGLAIVRKGVERMGGRVGVESVEGRGSRFWLELPAA